VLSDAKKLVEMSQVLGKRLKTIYITHAHPDHFFGLPVLKAQFPLNIALWIVQALLAIVFGMAGAMKLTQPKEKLATRTPYVEDFAAATIKLIGALELLGAIGLILPLLTGILPWLTSLAAAGLVLTMLGAMATHVRRHEYQNLVVNGVLLLLAAFVAYGRIVAIPA